MDTLLWWLGFCVLVAIGGVLVALLCEIGEALVLAIDFTRFHRRAVRMHGLRHRSLIGFVAAAWWMMAFDRPDTLRLKNGMGVWTGFRSWTVWPPSKATNA